ncbi:C2 domain-containing protein [Lentithecium fluviatile CBS 122367]|uniref:C2 domain-containing protein n=1 Tax=Lentithecium fluviatile CBS 122367 TaxID=1168545 RepID=A0A6G1IYY8_9PLEO|nr:C2 domain-containing protein [Lentithecium fluviatile CBS 122367]
MAGESDSRQDGAANAGTTNGNAREMLEKPASDPPQPPAPTKTRTNSSKKEKGPEGGFDDTPIPRAPPGYTLKITLHRATNLPLADINTLSADPFIVAELTTSLPTRHKEDPPLQLRTPTIRQSTDPVWNTQWIVANVPASGFRLKCRIYDEDPADHDDRLGNAHIVADNINESWPGIKDQPHPIKKRMGSKRAYLLRALAVCFNKVEHMNGSMYVSVENLGRTSDENGGRVYTLGPQFWIRHYSPLLGRLLGQKEPSGGEVSRRTGKPKAERYNFQSNQMQLRGPVPEAMYHRYVEFKPFIKSMFTAKGVRGFILSKALHHQHARVYNFDRETAYEVIDEPCKAFTQKFLELVHYDQGGRIFTYVLTLDALFRFTETGKEFGIDMLSKHTMHSDVAAYVAFSGEFFIRRLKHPHSHSDPPETGSHNKSHPPDEIANGPPQDEPNKDPSYYELIIDNDSGTYRPNAKLLPQLKSFFEANFPGIRVITLDCQGDAEKMGALKKEQRERKKAEGGHIVYTQISRSSSMSSSDVDELDRLEEMGERPEPHLRHQVMRETGARVDAVKLHAKQYRPSNNHEGWRGNKHPPGQDDATVAAAREEAGQDESSEASAATAQAPKEQPR